VMYVHVKPSRFDLWLSLIWIWFRIKCCLLILDQFSTFQTQYFQTSR